MNRTAASHASAVRCVRKGPRPKCYILRFGSWAKLGACPGSERTRELVAKDLVFGGRYEYTRDPKSGKVQVALRTPSPSPYNFGPPDGDDGGDEDGKKK